MRLLNRDIKEPSATAALEVGMKLRAPIIPYLAIFNRDASDKMLIRELLHRRVNRRLRERRYLLA